MGELVSRVSCSSVPPLQVPHATTGQVLQVQAWSSQVMSAKIATSWVFFLLLVMLQDYNHGSFLSLSGLAEAVARAVW